MGVPRPGANQGACISAKGLHHACLPLMHFLKFLQASPAAKRLPAGRPPHQARLWLVLVCGHARAAERPPLHLSLCHRYRNHIIRPPPVLMSQMMSEVVTKQTDLLKFGFTHDVFVCLLVLPLTFVVEGAPQQNPTSLPRDGFPR